MSFETPDLYYDWSGNPITQDEWTSLFSQDRTVGNDMFLCPSGEATISTVYLGLDHSFGNGPPLFFETMIFCGCDEIHGSRI